MPISAWGDFDAQHWGEVRDVLERAIHKAGFEPQPVWESVDTDIIQGRIVRNLYENPMLICDISGLNPNVMFELGMRLTFRKPVVIVADNTTRLPFDTNVIDTLIYPADQHFSKIERFIEDLAERLTRINQSVSRGQFKPYLDTFGAFTVVEPQPDRVEFDQYVIQKLTQIGDVLRVLEREAADRHAAKPSLDYIVPASENYLLLGQSGWTPERLEVLIRLWEEGRSASEIADVLGGVSRNAVIGKAHRLGLRTKPPVAQERAFDIDQS